MNIKIGIVHSHSKQTTNLTLKAPIGENMEYFVIIKSGTHQESMPVQSVDETSIQTTVRTKASITVKETYQPRAKDQENTQAGR